MRVMRRLLVAAIAAATVTPFVASAGQPPTEPPVEHVTVQAGEGLWGVARRLCPHDTNVVYQALQQANPWYTAGLHPGTILHLPAGSCPAAPTTSSTSTSQPTTSTSQPTSTTPPPPPDDVHPVADIPSNFDTADFLDSRPIPASSAHEPTGNFRTLCRPSHFAQDDPIVNPGTQSGHLHLFFGNTAADRDSTYTSLRTTGDSTCEGGPINRTGYWMPAVFDGQGRVIPPSIILLYYKATASGGSLSRQQADIRSTAELPNGLRMIAGADSNIRWKCGDGSNEGPVIPDHCPTGYLIAWVLFPSCWDGVNLDSPDHRSHMAYKFYDNGVHVCPASHPVRLPDITENFHWMTDANDVGEWYLSSDMGAPRGSTLHADWFGAWDNPVQTRWHTHCLVEMRTSNNGDLCDGQGLVGATFAGELTSAARVTLDAAEDE